MKPKVITFILCLFFSLNSFAQDWMQFKAYDAVNDFQLHENYLWTISGSGLTRIDINTEEKTNWNALGFELLDYRYNELLVDDEVRVWLGGTGLNNLMKFDGVTWEQINFINGDSIRSVLDIQKTPDGKVWIYGSFDDGNLFYFENGTYQEVAPPDSTLLFYGGTTSRLGVGSDSHIWTMFRNLDNTYRVLGEFTGAEWVLHNLAAQGISLTPNMSWVYDSQGDLYMLIPTSSGFNFLKYDGQDWTFMNAPVTTNDFNNSLRPMYIDANDHIWVGLKNNTFIEYDGQDWVTHNLEDIGLENGFPDGLFIDDNDKQWIIYNQYGENGSTSGVKRTILKTFDNNETQTIDLSNSDLSTNNVGRIMIDGHNNKWFDSRNGLLKFDGINWFDYPPATSNTFDLEFLSGVDQTGNAWLQTYNESIVRFDGTSFFEIDLYLSNGDSMSSGYNLAVGKNGEIYNATGENEIIVFDNGEISYLDSMEHTSTTGGVAITYLDYTGHVEVDTFGNVYTLGYSINKYEGGEWIEIPLWSQQVSAFSFKVAPNQDIWVGYGGWLPDQGLNFRIYDGVTWEILSTPFELFSYPKWDNQGVKWFKTDQGLCKNSGSDWTCYNESNSPLVGENIYDFAIDESNNIWITLKKGGVMVFNENQIENIEAENLFTLSGSIYQDLNQNEEKDTSDLSIALQRVRLLPDSITTFSYEDGTYRFSVSPGDYEVEFLENTDWVIDNSPSVYIASVDTLSISNLDFRVGVFTAIFNQEKNLLELNVFPNPTSSEIFFSTTSPDFERFQYIISNAQGQIIQSGEINSDEVKSILLDKLPAGIYWIQVGNEKKIGTSRFVKI
jgi:hypothetical protein